MTGGWFNNRFIEREGATRCECVVCGKAYWMPPSKATLYKTCGTVCGEARRAALKESRRRSCLTCGVTFYPRHTQINKGVGEYCSQRCNVAAREAIHAPDAKRKAHESFMRSLAAGRVRVMRGDLNGRWKGGPEESKRRYRESGMAAQSGRRWAKKNPEKVREKATRRNGRKLGRLEYGSIKRTGERQRWRCAICKTSVKRKYHVDHIMPLALGGEHCEKNIQILCPSCNVKKWATPPIEYMQKVGFLL